eukprot:g36313.t1
MHTKNRKLEKPRITTSTNQAIPGTMVKTDAIIPFNCFILNHKVFTFNNLLFIQTHGTVTWTKFASQYDNMFILTMDYCSESVSFLDTRISIKDGHLSTSLYSSNRPSFVANYPAFSRTATMTPHQTCHSNLCKTCQIIDMDTTIT